MLQKMRDNAQSWVAKVIVGVIVLIFALTGWESISRFTSDEQKAAEVNETLISKVELEQAIALQRQQLIRQLQQFNDNFDPSMIDDRLLRDSVLDGLIERAVLIDGAEDAKLRISEQMIDQLILSTPDFQNNGQFDANRFDIVIRNMGLPSRLAFRDLVRQELMIGQLRNAYEASAFATPLERMHLARLEEQSRDFAAIELRTDNAAVSVSDEEVSDYFTANASQFMTEEQVILEIVSLSRSDFFDQVQVDEEALNALYEREIGNLSEQRRVSQILVEVPDASADQAALEKIEAVRVRLQDGEDFATVAREVSDDPGTASSGGDMGYAMRGDFEPEFEEALFSLAEGEVSAPVRTSYGYHLIKLTGLLAPEVPSFESMRQTLEQELKVEQVERRFVEATRELSNLAYESPDLEEPARALGVEIQTVGPVARIGGDEGFAANPRVMLAAFDDEVLKDGLNSPLLELDADTALVLRVKEHIRASQRPLEEVAADIEDTLRFQKAVEHAEEVAAGYVQAMREGDLGATELAATLNSEWDQFEAMKRSASELPQALVRSVFSMPRPQGDAPVYANFRQPDGSQWIVELRGVATPENLAETAGSEMYFGFVAGQTGQQDFAALEASLKQDAEITRY
ncbi:MAG: peptidylprolyl isomerase [Gammaproteobacteria bacterium HGW-Gammaproteobacteria-6]|nr:MAG: peptidylprolyl isomerase [Gammaproteobacteria bacterium HGW-Gammaproteobacteria-6]